MGPAARCTIALHSRRAEPGANRTACCRAHTRRAACPLRRLLHEPPNTLELRLLEAESADLKFKMQAGEGQLGTERQRTAAAEQAALEAQRAAAQAEERLGTALGR